MNHVYNVAGQLIAEYDDVASLPPGSGGTSYLTTDHLGSTRVVTGQDQSVKARYDYLPFGEALGAELGGRTPQMGYDAASELRQKFTQKERDNESGLDYFLARYYSAVQGKFNSTDPVFFQKEMISDPQRFNGYQYTRNNPLRFIDPEGEVIEVTGTDEERAQKLAALREAFGSQADNYIYEYSATDKDGTTRHFVGIHQYGRDGKGPHYSLLADNAPIIGRILADQSIATIKLVDPNTWVRGRGTRSVLIGSLREGISDSVPGATDAGDYYATIWLLNPSSNYGELPGWAMSNRSASQLDITIVLAHELGHVAFEWGFVSGPSRDAAVRMENRARKARDPNGPTRIKHSRPDPELGKGNEGLVLKIRGPR